MRAALLLPRTFYPFRVGVARLTEVSLSSVSAFRVLLGAAVLWDLLAKRLPWFSAWYTDGGLFRGGEIYSLLPPVFPFFYGHPVLSIALFLALIGAVLLFTVGYRPRLMAVLSGLLLISLDARNPFIINSGHQLMGAFMLLGSLLPLAGSSGFEAALDPSPRESLRTPVMLVFLLLAFAAYFLNSVAKDFQDYFVQGAAVYQAMSNYGTVLGEWVAERFYPYLPCLSRYAWLVEAGAPLLLLVPLWRIRLLGLLLLSSLHLGFLLFLDIGNFPLVMLSFLALFLPAEFWRLFRRSRPPVTVHYDGGCGFCQRVVAVLGRILGVRILALPAEGQPGALLEERRSWVVEREGRYYTEGWGFYALLRASPFWPLAFLWKLPGFAWWANRVYRQVADHRPSPSWTRRHLPERPVPAPGRGAVVLAMAFVLAYGTYSLYGPWDYGKAPLFVSRILSFFDLDLAWGHFAPTPPRERSWPVAVGVTMLGEVVDPWRFLIGKPPRYRPEEIPRHPSLLAGGEHWRKVWWGSLSSKDMHLRSRGLARYLCNHWNNLHPAKDWIAGVSLYISWAKPGDARPGSRLLTYQACGVERMRLEVKP